MAGYLSSTQVVMITMVATLYVNLCAPQLTHHHDVSLASHSLRWLAMYGQLQVAEYSRNNWATSDLLCTCTQQHASPSSWLT